MRSGSDKYDYYYHYKHGRQADTHNQALPKAYSRKTRLQEIWMSRALFSAISLENNIKKNMETDKAGEKERKKGARN